MRLCLSGEERDGEGWQKSTAGAGGPLSLVDARKASGTGVSGLHGRSIFVRERKGSSPWCSPPQWPSGGRTAGQPIAPCNSETA